MAAVCAVMAGGLAGYLAWHTWTGVQVIGCGGGGGGGGDVVGGCDGALSSRWAWWLGVPVGVPAVAVYVVVLIALGRHATAAAGGSRPVRVVLTAMAVMLVGGGVWFLALQFVAVGAWCRWCVVTHVMGFTTAAWLVTLLVYDPPPPRKSGGSVGAWAGVVLGALALAVLIGGQWLDDPGPAIAGPEMAAPPDADRQLASPDAGRIVLLNGGVVLDRDRAMMVGDADAAHVVAIFYDYNCPHCRHAHAELMDLHARRDDVAVVLMPTPLPSDCNRLGPSLNRLGPRFESSCELAAIAIALHLVAPDQTPAFDAWMFAGDDAPTAAAARERARSLVSQAAGEAMEKLIGSDEVAAVLSRNTQAWGEAGFDSVPVLASPGRESLYFGSSDSAEDVERWLEEGTEARRMRGVK